MNVQNISQCHGSSTKKQPPSHRRNRFWLTHKYRIKQASYNCQKDPKVQVDMNRIKLDNTLYYNGCIGPYRGHKSKQYAHHELLERALSNVVLEISFLLNLLNFIKEIPSHQIPINR